MSVVVLIRMRDIQSAETSMRINLTPDGSKKIVEGHDMHSRDVTVRLVFYEMLIACQTSLRSVYIIHPLLFF